VVENISADFTTSPGNVIIHFIIHNNGTAAAGTSTACKVVNGVVVATDSVPRLGISGRYNGAFGAEPCPPGTAFTVTVEADNYHVVPESNKRNNNRTETFICPAGPQPGGPDLVITKWVEKEVRLPNQCRFKVHYTVTNIGNAVAVFDWADSVALFVEGAFVADEWCQDLGPGASYTDEFNWVNCPIGGGIRSVTVCADYYNLVAESNEGNNNDTNTVDCRLGDIEVFKDVWDPAVNDWDDDRDAVYDDIVQFRCRVHSSGCCCNLTQITVTDVLSDSLEFLDATGTPTVTAIPGGETTLTWNVAGPLEPCEWLNYIIWARVIGCGVDTNTQTAVATNCTGGTVTDSDTATVNVAVPDPRIDVDKRVRNPITLRWVDQLLNVPAGTQLRYRCTVHNTGCCDLTNVEVWDTLPIGLRYDGVGANTPPPRVTGDVTIGTTLTWTVPAPFEHCETERYTIFATPLVATQGYNNIQYARGYCAVTNTWADDNENVWVTTA
jgi:uncharacterized repeat protein (TIGR01451 family)